MECSISWVEPDRSNKGSIGKGFSIPVRSGHFEEPDDETAGLLDQAYEILDQNDTQK